VFSNGLSRKDKERTRKGQGKYREDKKDKKDKKRAVKNEKRTSVKNILVFLSLLDSNSKKHLF
jgi:hypothetical protein